VQVESVRCFDIGDVSQFKTVRIATDSIGSWYIAFVLGDRYIPGGVEPDVEQFALATLERL
jgi:hypothetical protein